MFPDDIIVIETFEDGRRRICDRKNKTLSWVISKEDFESNYYKTELILADKSSFE